MKTSYLSPPAALKAIKGTALDTPETRKALRLRNGNRNAERVEIVTDRKTGTTRPQIVAPWLLSGVFSLPKKG